MQVEQPNLSSSSPLTSLVSSSNPSLDAAPAPGARAKVTYARKPVDSDANDPTRSHVASASSSSQPASPSDNLFDSPMRSYGRVAALRDASGSADNDDTGDATVTALVSPATTAHAANSAVKHSAPAFRHRHRSRSPSPSDAFGHSDEENQPHNARETSPVFTRPKRFQLGVAKAIFDSDSEDEPTTASRAQASTSHSDPHDAHTQDDDAIIARIRAQAAREASSDAFAGSLSSLPPSSSRDSASEDADAWLAPPRRQGAKISAMRGKAGAQRPRSFSSSSDNQDDQPDRPRGARAFKLVSSSSQTPAAESDPHQDDLEPNAHLSRREKMDALAAKARLAHGTADPSVNTDADGESLLDSFFSASKEPTARVSRSPSLDIQDSDADEHNDAMPAFMASKSNPSSKSAKLAKLAKRSKSKQAPAERDILSDLEDEAPIAASKSHGAPKDQQQPKVKALSKKEVDSMHKQTARLARENRARLAVSQPKKTIGLGELLSKISAGEKLRAAHSQSTSGSNSANTEPTSSAQPSSQIPSGQSKSQHASDPIESDPIPERSSPHPNLASSPLVPVSRKHEQRLDLDAAAPSNANADDDDVDLPDLASLIETTRANNEAKAAAARQQQHLREMKLRLLERTRQIPPSHAALDDQPDKTILAHVDDEDEDDDDAVEIYQPGSVLAQKHNLSRTPGKKRPADRLYRELGIKSERTPPSNKAYVGTDANGSPNAASAQPGVDTAAAAEDHDECIVTNSQLRNASKTLFLAADQAAGNIPASQPAAPATQSYQAARNAPPKMSQADLNSSLMRRMQNQSLKSRSQLDPRDAAAKLKLAALAEDSRRANAPDIQAMLSRFSAPNNRESRHEGREQDAGEDEDDPDYIMPAARDAESVIGSVIGSDIDMGSASEAEADDFDDDRLEMGSVDEEQDDADAAKEATDEAEEEHDSEKENAPPASQLSQRSHASPNLGRSLPPSRAVMDDDEDELPAPRVNVRRGRRSALADDDAEELDADNPLRPGPFDAIRGEAVPPPTHHSQDRARVPLGDISSQSIDQSMALSRSNTTSPAMPHAQLPAAAASARRDSLVFPPSAGQEMDESFRTDDIPSQAGDLGRFFESTLPPATTANTNVVASQALRKSFWDQTQTQSQTQDPSQASHLPTTHVARELARDASANSALGAFFNATQDDELRGESLDIFANPKNARDKATAGAAGTAGGLTQLFNDGTPAPSADGHGGAEASKLASVWDASTMPPPKSTEVDAFAALRKAQMGEAMELLDPTPSVLPSFDESQAEREAYAQAQSGRAGANMSPEKMYMNRDGFFTQTKPSQQAGLWSQYDTQSQSQSQEHAASSSNCHAHSGAWQSPAADASARRGRNDAFANPSRKIDVLEDDDDDDEAPVQLKRLRRGGARDEAQAAEADARSNAESDADDQGPPSSQPEPRPRNAFDVLRRGPLQPEDAGALAKGKKRKSAFIEGEAEESEDEELGGGKRGDGGGLKGVFGDEDDSTRGADEDEDDEEDDDAEDLQELVDNERDADEAAKDEVARARFREDMEAQDREELEMHQKAVQGGYRNRRGRAGLNGIEGFLDDDADEEELRRRAAMGAHMNAAWKKRKLLDGTQDGMDALAAHDEAKAFVQSYAATHQIEHESDKYDFLLPQPGDDDAEESDEDDVQEDGDDEEEEEEEENEGVGKAGGEDVDEDAFGPVVTKQPRKIRYDDVRTAIRERRRAKNRAAVDDDEEDEQRDEGKGRNGWDSEEDDGEERLAKALRDRVRGEGAERGDAVGKQRKPVARVQYGRAKARPSVAAAREDADEMDVDADPTGAEEDADEDASDSLMARLLVRPTATRGKNPFAAHSQTLSMAVDTLDDAEPEWGNDANIVRAPKPTASGTSQGSQPASASRAGTRSAPSKSRQSGAGGASMLLSKQAIMRRESGFSSSSSR